MFPDHENNTGVGQKYPINDKKPETMSYVFYAQIFQTMATLIKKPPVQRVLQRARSGGRKENTKTRRRYFITFEQR